MLSGSYRGSPPPLGTSLIKQRSHSRHHPDLGVLVDSNLKFHQHSSNTVHEMECLPHSLLTVCRFLEFMMPLLCSRICSVIEHCSCMWFTDFVMESNGCLNMINLSADSIKLAICLLWVDRTKGRYLLHYLYPIHDKCNMHRCLFPKCRYTRFGHNQPSHS